MTVRVRGSIPPIIKDSVRSTRLGYPEGSSTRASDAKTASIGEHRSHGLARVVEPHPAVLGRALKERSQLRFLWAFLFQLCGRIPSVIYRIYQVARDYAEGPPLAAEGILKACRCQSERASMTTSRN
jgi:hypothetical protein